MLQSKVWIARKHSLGLLVLGLLAVGAPAWAQDGATKTKPKADAKPKAERRHRLPPHFADVVTEEQRAEIYKLQDEIGPEIDALVSQLAALRKKLDDAMRGVLKPDQLKKVDEAAAKRRATRRTAATEEDDAAPAPARRRRSQ
ncbi:MAG: hypothetical protein AB7U73_04640 [Pirellulales bacterium]